MEELNLPSGKYSLIRILKSDDRGNVCLAEHKTMGVKRIIKKSSGAGALRKSLMREAYILSRLKHPFIPAVCDIEETEDAFYIIEEYIEGLSLYDFIRENGIFEQDKGLETGVKLAEIIDFLHSGNSFKVCHLDIQPKNIIINGSGVYLIDFANSICSDDSTNAGIMATKGFAPPEQYMQDFAKSVGKNITDAVAADIYGLGAVLLYIFTGIYKEAFEPDEIKTLLCQRAVNQDIAAIVASALSKNSNLRQGSMSVVCRQLYRAANNIGLNVNENVRYSAKMFNNRMLSDGIINGNRQNKSAEFCSKSKPYVISIVGADRGAGATYISILLTAILNDNGINALYEENHGRDTVRQLAKAYAALKYDKGCFVLNGIAMKPRYNDNIRIQTECSVSVRDEGTVEECQKTGDYIIMVAQADVLGWGGISCNINMLRQNIGSNVYADGKDISSNVYTDEKDISFNVYTDEKDISSNVYAPEKNISSNVYADERNISVIYNRCDGETYRKEAAISGIGDGYMESLKSPFYAEGVEIAGIKEILRRLLTEIKKGDKGCEENYKPNTYRRNAKHRNSFRKKR